jgi:hypothetical protein
MRIRRRDRDGQEPPEDGAEGGAFGLYDQDASSMGATGGGSFGVRDSPGSLPRDLVAAGPTGLAPTGRIAGGHNDGGRISVSRDSDPVTDADSSARTYPCG